MYENKPRRYHSIVADPDRKPASIVDSVNPTQYPAAFQSSLVASPSSAGFIDQNAGHFGDVLGGVDPLSFSIGFFNVIRTRWRLVDLR